MSQLIDAATADKFKQRHAELAERQAANRRHVEDYEKELRALCALTGYRFEQCFGRDCVYRIVDENEVSITGTVEQLAGALFHTGYNFASPI